MYAFLKGREYGTLHPLQFKRAETTKRVYSLSLSAHKEVTRLHRGSVNSVKVENVEQRYMLSAGGDGRIHVYDLEKSPENAHIVYSPVASTSRADRHMYAVTTASWFPFDTGMIISSSFDKTVRIWDTNTMTAACVFSLDARVNCAAISPIATHCLVASAAQEPRITLCDLKTGASTHSLAGHQGSVMSVVWSPRQEHTLYSGGVDGSVRVWDIRQANACIMVLDQHNTPNTDVLSPTNYAHGKGVNGLTVTSDGLYLVSLGLDEKVRLWDTCTGRNTLVNYGTAWRNGNTAFKQASVSDGDVWPPALFLPSDDNQTLVYELMTGKLSRRLRGAYGRVTCAEYRSTLQELYTGSSDCEILVWEPQVSTDLDEEVDHALEDTWSDSDPDEEMDHF